MSLSSKILNNEHFINYLKQKLIQTSDELTCQIDIAGQCELLKNERNVENMAKDDAKLINRFYDLLIRTVKMNFEKSINEINDFTRNNDCKNFDDKELLEKRIISSSCFFMGNDDLNYICANRNRIGIFITFDWYLNVNQYNFLR
jgi:hypothetical protein